MIAPCVLLTVAVAAPWAFGCVDPLWWSVLSLGCLVPAAASFAAGSLRSVAPAGPSRPAVHAAALLPVPALLALVPLPGGLLDAVAPGAGAVWSQLETPPGWRPSSLRPRSTVDAAVLATAYAAAFLVLARAARSPRFRAAAATALCVAGCALAAFALFQGATQTDPPTIYWTHAIYEVTTPFGPYVNRNHFAGAMEVLAAVAAGEVLAAWASGRRVRAAVFCAAVVLMSVALLRTTSRGGVVGLGAAAVFLVAAAPGARRLRGVLVVVLAVGGIVAAAAAAGWLDGVLKGLLRVNPRWSHRFVVQADALAVFARNPLIGTGPGTFEDVYPAFQRIRDLRSFGNAHSDWAQFLMEGGLAGVVAAGACVRAFVGDVRTGLTRPGPDRWTVVGPAAAVVAIAAHGFFDVNLHVPANALLTVVALSLACGAAQAPEGTRDRTADGPSG